MFAIAGLAFAVEGHLFTGAGLDRVPVAAEVKPACAAFGGTGLPCFEHAGHLVLAVPPEESCGQTRFTSAHRTRIIRAGRRSDRLADELFFLRRLVVHRQVVHSQSDLWPRPISWHGLPARVLTGKMPVPRSARKSHRCLAVRFWSGHRARVLYPRGNLVDCRGAGIDPVGLSGSAPANSDTGLLTRATPPARFPRWW